MFFCCLNIPIPKFDWFGELLVERVSGQMVMRGISSRPVNHRHPCTTLTHAVRSLHTSQICFFFLQENKHKNTSCSPYQPPRRTSVTAAFFSLSLLFLRFSGKSDFWELQLSRSRFPPCVLVWSVPDLPLSPRWRREKRGSPFSLGLRGRAEATI